MKKQVLLATILMFGSSFARANNSLFSIEPWLSKETGITDVSLEGEWELFWGCVTFVPHGDATYVYDVPFGPCGGGEDMAFTVSLHRVDERLLLVVGPKESDAALLLPVYWLFKVELDDDRMNLYAIDEESFEWRAAGSNIEHKTVVDGVLLVLSPTKDLASFVSWQVGDFSFFEDEPEFTLTKIESDD